MIALRKFELFEAATSLLYPPVCTLCGGKTQAGEHLCDQCEAKAMRIVAPFCQQCSEPFEGAIATSFTCANCAHRKIYFDAAVAPYRGRGIVRQIIHDLSPGVRFICDISWRVGSMRRLTMNVFAGVNLTSSCPSHCIQLAGGNADSIKRACLLNC